MRMDLLINASSAAQSNISRQPNYGRLLTLYKNLMKLFVHLRIIQGGFVNDEMNVVPTIIQKQGFYLSTMERQ